MTGRELPEQFQQLEPFLSWALATERERILRDINMEDGSTVERTQLMLASGAKREIVLQDQELLIRHHHKVAETFLKAD